MWLCIILFCSYFIWKILPLPVYKFIISYYIWQPSGMIVIFSWHVFGETCVFGHLIATAITRNAQCIFCQLLSLFLPIPLSNMWCIMHTYIHVWYAIQCCMCMRLVANMTMWQPTESEKCKRYENTLTYATYGHTERRKMNGEIENILYAACSSSFKQTFFCCFFLWM